MKQILFNTEPEGSKGDSIDEASDRVDGDTKPSLSKKLLRSLCSAKSATAALGVLGEEGEHIQSLSQQDCLEIMLSCVAVGNDELLVSIYSTMIRPGQIVASSSSDIDSTDLFWPVAQIELSVELVKSLCRTLNTKTALKILQLLVQRGVEMTEDIKFGFVVECPDDSGRPLTLLQPQEGSKMVIDSVSRYEYEAYSGVVVKSDSSSLVANNSWIKRVIISRFGQLAASAVHIMTVETPSGQQRTFRYGTISSDAPAKLGDRITVVVSPEAGKTTRKGIRYQGPLAPSPPGSRPGEPLSLTNHTSDSTTRVFRPPRDDSSSLIPGWVVTSFLVIAGADAASSLFDPTLPYLLAGAVASAGITSAVTTNVILPKLKQLPEQALIMQATRQKLLQEHVRLAAKLKSLTDETIDDIRVLARLWQLLNKMESVGSNQTYSARMERVQKARDIVEERLSGKIKMTDEYVKVLNMIEIEVEMETEVPLAEYEGPLTYPCRNRCI